MAELDMMRCDRQRMTLSKQGCARLWRSTQEKRPAPHEARFNCLTCPIGAGNAGVSIAVTAAATEALRTFCPRCLRRAFRMIANRLCVSCYNREREVQIGKNRKGGRPRLTDILHSARLVAIDAGSPRIVLHSTVTGLPEAMIAMARSATGVIAFGRLNLTEAQTV